MHPELEHKEQGLHPTAFLCTPERLQHEAGRRRRRLDFTYLCTFAHADFLPAHCATGEELVILRG